MKKLLFATVFLLSTALPSQALGEAETCLNSLANQQGLQFSSAQLVASIEHEGSQYHYIKGSYKEQRVPGVRIFLKTDSQGSCKKIMSYLAGSAPSEQFFKEKLGAEVFYKLRQKAQAQ